ALGFSEFVEPFDPDKYNSQSSIAENLLFGTANTSEFQLENLPENSMVLKLLKEEQLELTLFNMGKEIAGTTIELFGDLDPENPFFDQLTYMDSEEIPEYRAALSRIGDKAIGDITEKDRLLIMRLPFAYIEEQNRLGLLTEELKEKILDCRRKLGDQLAARPDEPVALYETETYNDATSILDNVLLGRISSAAAEGMERVTLAIQELLDEMGLTDDIFRIGLEFNVGSGGKRLSDTQRQKLHLARALLKRPDILIAKQPLNSLGRKDQEDMITMVLDRSKDDTNGGFGVIWVPMDPSLAKHFDRIMVFNEGALVSDGEKSHIMENDTQYAELVT
ncbi:MAG: ABC transporter ATP-binding protein, partial [Pseudomonadota bacterium]